MRSDGELQEKYEQLTVIINKKKMDSSRLDGEKTTSLLIAYCVLYNLKFFSWMRMCLDMFITIIERALCTSANHFR